jgi:glycosyltransferase involved in cell wall biosynthesis
MAQRGHEVTILTAEHPRKNYEYPSNLKVEALPVLFRVGNAPLLAHLYVRLRGFDVIHLHYPFVFGQEMVFLRALLSGLPYIITYHQDIIFNDHKDLLIQAHHFLLGKWILRQASRLLVTSTDYAHASRIASLVRSLNGRVVEMPNGVDSDRFHPTVSAEDWRSRYGLQDDDNVVLFVGGLDTPHYFKGVDILIHAISQIPDDRIKLAIVGDGDLRPKYMTVVDQLQLNQRVVFCGYVSDADLPAHYAMCDVLVLPSTTMGEAFGVVLLEAMATGKPTIASNLPGVRSVVANGVTGHLVAPGNAHDLAIQIQHLLANPQQRLKMGEQGRARVEERYSWKVIDDRLETVYSEVVL